MNFMQRLRIDTEITFFCHRKVVLKRWSLRALQTMHLTSLEGSIPLARHRFHVALVTETYPPEINGVAITVARVVEGLLESGNKVQLIRPRQSPQEVAQESAHFSEILTRGVPIPRYSELRIGLPIGRLLEKTWRSQRPEVVHIATQGPLGWSALKVARRLKIPVVAEYRTNFHAYSNHYGIGFMQNSILGYLRSFHNQSNCTMVPTAALGRELESMGFDRLIVVGRGVDTQLFNPAHRDVNLRAEWGAKPDTLVALSVGRLAAEKNLDLLERAFARMKAVRSGTRLVMVGDGPERSAMQRSTPDAVFAGKCYGEDLARHYASADLLLFPSTTETFGNVTIEAMASGLPVVAFNYGAAKEVIRNECNGWTVPYADSEAYLRAVKVAAGDLENVRSLGAHAQTDVCELGWNAIIERIEDCYRREVFAKKSAVAFTSRRGAQTPLQTPLADDVSAY